MRKKLIILFLLSGIAMVAGCGSERQAISSSNDPLCLPDTMPEQVMQAAQTILLDMHFDIEKYDTEARYIRTRPLSGAQFFEIWRQDNASVYSAAQANFYSLRRIIELEFIPQNTTTCVQCRAQVLRLSMPERPIEGAGHMGEAYTKSSSRYQTLEVNQDKQVQIEWIDIGADHDLERKILKRIQRDIEKGTKQ